jgi:hypothetical protein
MDTYIIEFRVKNFFCIFCFVPKNHTFPEKCLRDVTQGVFVSLNYILNLDLNAYGEDDDNDPYTYIDLNKTCDENEIRDTFFVSTEILSIQTS